MIWTIATLGTLVASFFILSVLSMLWKDNPIFRIGQQAVIGAATAHYIILNFESVYKNALTPMMSGNLLLIIPLFLGLLMYTRLKKETAWLARYPTAVLVGVGTGVMIAGTLRGQIIDQLKATVVDILNAPTSGGFTVFNTVLILIGTVTAVTFFTYTQKHATEKGLTLLGWSAKMGRIFLMISLGANWSGEIVWYLTQLIGRLTYLINFAKLLIGG
jgi:hypothetical protein